MTQQMDSATLTPDAYERISLFATPPHCLACKRSFWEEPCTAVKRGSHFQSEILTKKPVLLCHQPQKAYNEFLTLQFMAERDIREHGKSLADTYTKFSKRMKAQYT